MKGIDNIESTNDSEWVEVVATKLFYRKIGAIVYVKVLPDISTGWNTVGTLPARVAPSQHLYFSNSNVDGANLDLVVSATGVVSSYANTTHGTQISYCLG